MSPPISKDWWIAAAMTGAALPAAVGQTTPATVATAGVVTAVAPASSAAGTPTLTVGKEVQPGQRLSTGPGGAMHLLFLDQSAVTLGPESELIVEVFQFDPATRQGQIQLRLTKGLLRVVGGQISKTQPTVVLTPQARVETQGGISIVDISSSQPSATFLFGQQMRVSSNAGGTQQTVTRPGFGVSFSSNELPTPVRSSPSQVSDLLSRFPSPGGSGSGGNPNPSPAPAGQLISTGNGGSPSSPGSNLANDRLPTQNSTPNQVNPSRTLRDILGSGQTPNAS